MSTNKKKIKIGVLGCASVAQRSVIPAVMSLRNFFDLIAVSSRTIDKATKFAMEFGCKAIVGYENLIRSDEVNALYIPLPTGLHREWVNKALQAGKHVYAEKSIASCYADAKEMVSNARKNSLALMEGYMFQYHSQHGYINNLLKIGEIGKIRYFFSAFGFPPLPVDNFRYNEQLGGGVLHDAAGYPLRAAHFILGDSLKVRGATLHHDARKGTDIYGSAFLSNSNGLGASIAFGFNNYYQCRYEIWGEKGKIIADRAFTPQLDYRPEIIVETANGTKTIQAEPDNHFIKAFEEFYRIINRPDARQKHYSDILLQSHSLEMIKNLSMSQRT
jgi:dTDP-3,4-didehydro-2,6-dideoxy-alpha-D-glucose 3-reductase